MSTFNRYHEQQLKAHAPHTYSNSKYHSVSVQLQSTRIITHKNVYLQTWTQIKPSFRLHVCDLLPAFLYFFAFRAFPTVPDVLRSRVPCETRALQLRVMPLRVRSRGVYVHCLAQSLTDFLIVLSTTSIPATHRPLLEVGDHIPKHVPSYVRLRW